MKTVTVTPELNEIINAWAQANPIEFLFGATLVVMVACYFLKELF